MHLPVLRKSFAPLRLGRLIAALAVWAWLGQGCAAGAPGAHGADQYEIEDDAGPAATGDAEVADTTADAKVASDASYPAADVDTDFATDANFSSDANFSADTNFSSDTALATGAESAADSAIANTADVALGDSQATVDSQQVADPSPDVATPDTAKDSASGPAEPDGAAEIEGASEPPLPLDPTVYVPLAEYANPGWVVPPGLASSPTIVCDPDTPNPGGKFIDVVMGAGIDLDRPVMWPEAFPLSGYEVQEGGGQALGDFNGDGRLDIYFPVATGDDRLYLGQPGKNWSFKGFSVKTAGFEEVSAVAADLDGDGDLDLIIGGNGVRMYRNDGPDPYHGVLFTDMTTQAGLDAYANQPQYAAAVGDLDRDGWLDVLISPLRFEQPVPGLAPTGTFSPILLRGKGGFTFENSSKILPLTIQTPTYISALVDLDNDGDLDIYMGNDYGSMFGPNQILRNDGQAPGAPLQFSNVSVLSGADIAGNAMGMALGDFDRDGRIDIFMSGWEFGIHLLRNATPPGKKPLFEDVKNSAGVLETGPQYASWGAQFVDVDNDGWLDLLIPNGYLNLGGDGGTQLKDPSNANGGKQPGPGNKGGSPPATAGGDLLGNPKKQNDNLFKANGDGTFVDVAASSGFNNPSPGRAISVGDIDRDGFADLLLGTVYGAPQLYRNGCSDTGWLQVRLKGSGSNTFGIGARVTVTAGAVTLVRDIEAGSSSVWSSGEAAAFFGLGGASVADSLTVAWPSGKLQTFSKVPLKRRLLVTEP